MLFSLWIKNINIILLLINNMLGWKMVILWLSLFFTTSYFLCKFLKIKSTLLVTIFVWTFCMVFISIFEFLLLFYYQYLETKGEYYYTNDKCYWTDDTPIFDMFSYKMYMDLYADYSYCDKRYINNLDKCAGNRFVLTGEIIHGIFSAIFSIIILYFFFAKFDDIYIYLSSIIFSSIQFALIIWYLATIFIEKKFVVNDKEWLPPILWNVPWVIVPIYIIFESVRMIIPSQTKLPIPSV